jgi:hypothetical protein
MHSRFTQAKSVTLSSHHVVLAILGFMLITIICGALMAALTFRLASADLPFLRNILPASAALPNDPNAKDRYVKENLAAMAVKLGEMQAQLIRLDAWASVCKVWQALNQRSLISRSCQRAARKFPAHLRMN